MFSFPVVFPCWFGFVVIAAVVVFPYNYLRRNDLCLISCLINNQIRTLRN